MQWRQISEAIVWLLPASRAKNRILNRCGRHIALSAQVSPILVFNVGDVVLGENAIIGIGNVFRGLSMLRMDADAVYNSWNTTIADAEYQEHDSNAGTVFLGHCARVGSRCHIGASGTVIVQAFGNVGGNRCLVESGEPGRRGLEAGRVGRVVVGHHSQVSSNATMLCGSHLPAMSILAASSTLAEGRPGREMRSGLYVGHPARYVGDPGSWATDQGQVWMTRTTRDIPGHRIAEPQGIFPEDLWDGRWLHMDSESTNEVRAE